MITELLVIQQIDAEQKNIKVHQIQGQYFQWTYHTDEPKSENAPEYYPFEVTGEPRIITRRPGAETKFTIADDLISFKDEISVPAGSVMAILFPKGFIPDMLQFRNAAYLPVSFDLPVHQVIPGYVQLSYNFQAKRSAVIIHLTEKTYFKFKCVARKVEENQFPKHAWADSEKAYDVTINREMLGVDHISEDDLKIANKAISETMDAEALKILVQDLNELLKTMKAGDDQNSAGLLEKVGGALNASVGLASGAVTIADSFIGHNSAAQFVKMIMMFFNMK